jgi:multidrug resistance efflux pump
MKYICIMSLLITAGCVEHVSDSIAVTGQIEAVTVAVGSRIGGRIVEVLVREGDAIKQNDVLVRLESNEAESLLAAAQGREAQARATLTKLETGARPEELRQAEAAAARAEEQYKMALKGFRTQEVKGAVAMSDAARAQRDEAATEFKRIERLRQTNAVSQQAFDQARHALEAAEAQYRASSEKQNLTETGAREEEIQMAKAAFEQAAASRDLVRNGARKEDVDAARALLDAATADVKRAQVSLDEMLIKAPTAGVVESMDLHPGDIVKPGATITIADPEDLKLYVYVSAIMLGHVRLQQKVRLTTDAYGDESFEATVVKIATQGEYTPRNLQTQEERVQQVFGIKLKLNSAGGRLRAGMTVSAHFPTSDAPGLEKT